MTSIGCSGGVRRIARSTASESSMLIEPATGTPKMLSLSWRWIIAITRDLRASSILPSAALRCFSTPRPPNTCASKMKSSASQNAARARLARCRVQVRMWDDSRPRLAALAVVCLAASAWAQAPHTHEHAFEDADKWSEVFDDPKRDGWQKPHEVIQALALKPDAAVADIGAGTGYFSVRLAHMVPKGKVYAVDLEPDMVRHLAARAKRDQLPNMVAVQA